MNLLEKLRRSVYDQSLRQKLTIVFGITILILSVVNLMMYANIDQLMRTVDSVYESNRGLERVDETIDTLQSDLYDYLNMRSTEELEDYYRSSQELREQLSGWNRSPTDNPQKLAEKNISAVAETYLSHTDQAIEAKRGRNLSQYQSEYQKAERLYQMLIALLSQLNTEQFQANSETYQILAQEQQHILLLSVWELIITLVLNLLILFYTTGRFTQPLHTLALHARQVGKGDLEVEPLPVTSRDEVGVVSEAFNRMVDSLRTYIDQLRFQMEEESRLKERHLMMEAHLKDAQMGALQAHINPHFLYNTINAGTQLAMLEGADQTYMFLENVADYFRYNTRRLGTDSLLEEEVDQMESYLYIMNTRYAGEINYETHYPDPLPQVRIPSMVLQPLAENAIEHGIRGLDGEKRLALSVWEDPDYIYVEVSDNGVGIQPEVVSELMQVEETDSVPMGGMKGIGLANVISRLRLYYGDRDVLSIYSAGKDQGTQVRIRIPKSA